MTTETTGAKQHGRGWPKGVSGNPAGRPKGSRHTALLHLDAIGEEGATDVLRRVVEEAKGGDLRAAEILLRRVWPERKGRPVMIELPPMEKPADIVVGLAAVAAAMAAGEITPDEASAVAGVLEGQRRAIETADLEARLAALEAASRKAP